MWELGELPSIPEGLPDPYRLTIGGDPLAAAEMWAGFGCPYEQAISLTHGDEAAQLEALEILETLGAAAVAGKLRKSLRHHGLRVPRGKGKTTRAHAGGLTARQAEVLDLLDAGLSNTKIADRLFLSLRTVEHHVSAVIAKLNCSTRDEAVSRARSDGILSADARHGPSEQN
jgi:DNA-binding CsgD family transcriptional regulator